jgi:hypothetical protein
MPRLLPWSAWTVVAASAASMLMAGCGTLTQSSNQTLLVQTVLDYKPVDGVGCVLSNAAGRWFVLTPAKVTVKKAAGPLRVDCRKDGVASDELVGARQDRTLWGNYVLTGGLGNKLDRETGRGFEYPGVVTVVLTRDAPDPRYAPPEGRVVY